MDVLTGFSRIEHFFHSNVYIILTSTLLIFITTISFLYFRGSKSRSVLLMGRTGAGKTLLLCRLCSNDCPITVTSIQPTTLAYTHPHKKNASPLTLVDIPGDGRVRTKFLNEHKSRRIIGVLFLIDSANFSGSEAEVADVLFEMLSLKQFRKVPILFACNKQDLSAKDSCDSIRERLECEMQMKRSTQTDSPGALDPKYNPQVIGDLREEFNFNQIANKVTFVPCSITSERIEGVPGVEHVEDWLGRR